jgi:hypothetical protein
MSFTTRLQKRAWKALFGELASVSRFADFRAREQYGLIRRANYVYGMLRAADCAKYFGKRRVTAIEFGVASGAGLLNMVDVAEMIQKETGISFEIVGFDTGAGLPEIKGYKDHPEIWNPGDFAMEDRDLLVQKLGGRAKVIWGDIADTVGAFREAVSSESPIGFISVDVDIYSAAKNALGCLTGPADKYTPAVSMYFDDVSFFFANQWAGELAAIAEFNEQSSVRKIGSDRSLPGHRPIKAEDWYSAMYVCHILDHEARQTTANRSKLTIKEHAEFMKSRFLF